MKILVIEDSEKLRKSLKTGLKRLGYAVDFAIDGEQGLSFALNYEYDVVILDLMLPKMSGLDVLREIRLSRQVPEVLILSARGQVQDRVEGLDLGADDYLVKPFSFDELNARIQALVRRKYKNKSPLIDIHGFIIDTALHKLSYADQAILLTPSEMSIIEFLAVNKGRVISPQKLCEHIYSSDTYTSANAIEVHVSSLRKKLRLAAPGEIIKTHRGFGYYIDKEQ